MKIGIITLPPYANYGGILQAYALCHILQGMGHEPEVIYTEKQWERRPIWWQPISYAIRFINKYVLHKPNTIVFYEVKAKREWPTLIQHTFEFVNKYIPYREIAGFYEIKESDYDAFVVGSDQVWRPRYFVCNNSELKISDAFLRFAENWKVKRIAYAASFGVDIWEYTPEQSQECALLAKLFDTITVREASGVELCHKYLGVEAKQVIDPTLLLNRKDYEVFINDKLSPHSGELLIYMLDWNDEKHQIVDYLEKSINKRSFLVNSRIEDIYAPAKERIQPSVDSWLQGFRDADMIVTDSYHACVFSIIFNKPFYVIGNRYRGIARFTSLLSLFGLEDRLICSCESIDLNTAIDWGKVNTIVQSLKIEGLNVFSKLQ